MVAAYEPVYLEKASYSRHIDKSAHSLADVFLLMRTSSLVFLPNTDSLLKGWDVYQFELKSEEERANVNQVCI